MNAEYWFGRSWIIILAIIPACWPTAVEIIKARKPSLGLKLYGDVELALFTEMFGFVNDEHLHSGTAWHNILKQYQAYRVSETPYDTRNVIITMRYFGDEKSKASLCQAYLKDGVLFDNDFEYLHADPKSYSYELKLVQLHYFSRATELAKVVRCPVMFRDQITQLYFQEIRQEKMRYQHRGYFVFASLWTPEHTLQPLELLMFVPSASYLPTMPVETDEEADWWDATDWRRENTPRIRLHRKTPAKETHYFGKRAELLYLSKNYGFTDFTGDQRKVERLVSILAQMKYDYKVDRLKMKEVSDDRDTITTCLNYIQNNYQLSEHGISITENLIRDKISWIRKPAEFPKTNILELRYYRLLQCPVQSTGEHYSLPYLYILPVHYRNANKSPQLFTFMESLENPDYVIPYMLSPVNTDNFRSPRTMEPEITEPISYPGYSEAGPSGPYIVPGNIETNLYYYSGYTETGPSGQNIEPRETKSLLLSYHGGHTEADSSNPYWK